MHYSLQHSAMRRALLQGEKLQEHGRGERPGAEVGSDSHVRDYDDAGENRNFVQGGRGVDKKEQVYHTSFVRSANNMKEVSAHSSAFGGRGSAMGRRAGAMSAGSGVPSSYTRGVSRRPAARMPKRPACSSITACCLAPSTIVILYLVVLVFSSATERIAFKVMLDSLRPFRFFLAQLVMLLYVPVMFAVVAYKKLRTDDIQPEMEEFPKCKFALMALLDVAQVIVVMISGGVIPAPLTVLLLQSLIPATMLASRLFLGNRYKWQHCFGALVILVSITVNMLPLISRELSKQNAGSGTEGHGSGSSDWAHQNNSGIGHPTGSQGTGSGAHGSGGFPPQPTANEIAWNSLIYLLCCVPGALSAIYKESALKAQPMDIYFLNAWVAFFQFILSIPFAPIAFHFQEWSTASTTAWSDFRYLFENVGMGFNCWLFGTNPPQRYADGTPVLGAAYVHCNVSCEVFFFWCHLIPFFFTARFSNRLAYSSCLPSLTLDFVMVNVLNMFRIFSLAAGTTAGVLLHRYKHDLQYFCHPCHQARISYTHVCCHYCGSSHCLHSVAFL